MDLEDLHISSSPDSSLGRAGRHYRTADDNSDFNSLGSRKSHTSNQDNNETVSSTSFASSLGAGDYSYAQHISTNSNSKSRLEVEEEQGDGQPMTYQGVSSSESSLVYENIKNQFQSDDSSLGHIVEQLREMLEELSRRPNRYTRVLLILSNSLERLCEFTVSGDEEQDVPQIGLGSVPPRTDGHDEIEALDVLDRAVGSIQPAGNSPFSGCPQPTTSFSSPINTNTGSSARPYISSCGSFGDVGGVNATRQRADMTSGWAELDAVIRWHLQNVRRLLNVLASSPELFGMPGDLYGSGSGANGGANCKLSNPEHVLPVHQDSTAMALSDQAGILVALAGVVNFYDECRNQRQTICSTNCLDYGGTRSTGLLPGDFWRLVWDPEEGSMSRSQNSLLNLNSSSQTLNITLCIPREKLMEYFLHVCKDHCRFSDEDDVLQFAMEDLLDVVADSDITEHSWSYIPLTQICMRLKPTVRPSTAVPIYSPRTRSGSLQRQERAIYSTLRYIRSQTRLQRKLRQHDAEALYQTLEKLSADVQKRQRGNMSVNTFICVALNLLIPEVSIQSLAEDVIKGLTRITFGVNSDSANIPFLRAYGPCYMFAKAMQTFNNQLDTSHLLNASGYPKRGGNAFSPISSTLLWGVQSRADEEYRIASLKAYKIIFGGTGGVGDVDTNSRQPYQHRGQGRPGETAMWLRGADTEALHAGVHLLSVEDDSPVVRNLALETIQFRRSNLGLARSKFRSANCLIYN